MTVATPPEGNCNRCKQTRPLFPYKPEHDCIKDAGRVDLIEAAEWLSELELQDDRWCLARINRSQRLLCVPCHDKEHDEEIAHIKEFGL